VLLLLAAGFGTAGATVLALGLIVRLDLFCFDKGLRLLIEFTFSATSF
jgi:hypothetical protein